MTNNRIEKWDDVHGTDTSDSGMTAFLESVTDSYAILQLQDTPETRYERCASLDNLAWFGNKPNIDHYEVVYTGPLLPYKDRTTMLEEMFNRFNRDHPSDFTGHSMSVSDIVALKENGVVTCHYVEPVGFQELPNFLKPENYLRNAEMAMEDDYGMIDGVINNGKKEEVQERPSVLEMLKEKQSEPAFPRAARDPEERSL